MRVALREVVSDSSPYVLEVWGLLSASAKSIWEGMESRRVYRRRIYCCSRLLYDFQIVFDEQRYQGLKYRVL